MKDHLIGQKYYHFLLDPPSNSLTLMQVHFHHIFFGHLGLLVSPNGFMFVKPQVRKSLLSKMLSEFLDTRVMIKESMKAVKDDKVGFRITDV